jgi:hypothetical protein
LRHLTEEEPVDVRRPLTALSAVCLAAALGAAPASASIVAADSFPIDDLFPVGTCEGPDGTLYEMAQHDVGRGRFHDRFRGPAAQFGYDKVWFGSESGEVTSTYINATTGLSWTGTSQWLVKDNRLLEVDGTRRLYLRSNTAHSLIYDPDGSVVSRSDNRVEFTESVDTMGTPDPDDDEWEFHEVVKVAGRSTIGDFCEDALRFTVPQR